MLGQFKKCFDQITSFIANFELCILHFELFLLFGTGLSRLGINFQNIGKLRHSAPGIRHPELCTRNFKLNNNTT